MRNIAIFALLLLLAGTAMADSWEDVKPGTVPAASGSNNPANPVNNGRSLTFGYDEAAFVGANPELTWEGFDNTNVASGGWLQCEGVFNSETDNGCYSPGAIVEGITLHSGDAKDLRDVAVLADGFMGNSTPWAGPMWFNDHAFITFDPLVTSFGCLIVFPNGDVEGVEVEVFGVSGSLGTDTITGTTGGTFWSVTSSVDAITEISFHAPASNGEMIDYVYFGSGGSVSTEETNWSTLKALYR